MVFDLFQKHISKIKETQAGQFLGLCPFHDDRNPSFGFREDGVFNCFGCGMKGNSRDFAKLVGESASNLPNVVVSDRKVVEWSPPKPLNDSYNEIVMRANDKLLLNWDQYIGKLVWNKSIVKKLFVGWDNGFVFPYFNSKGELVNIKWHKKKQVKGHAQTFVYPFWQMMKKYDRNKTLYIVEGEKDTISVISKGDQAITFSNGANAAIPKDLMKVIQPLFIDIAILYDNDDAGRKATGKVLKAYSGKY